MQLLLVGERHFNAFGSHGSIDHVKLSYFPTLEECCDDLKHNKGTPFCLLQNAVVPHSDLYVRAPADCEFCTGYAPQPMPLIAGDREFDAGLSTPAGCRIVGIEITDDARPIQEHPFTGPTAFMLGNEVRRSVATP